MRHGESWPARRHEGRVCDAGWQRFREHALQEHAPRSEPRRNGRSGPPWLMASRGTALLLALMFMASCRSTLLRCARPAIVRVRGGMPSCSSGSATSRAHVGLGKGVQRGASTAADAQFLRASARGPPAGRPFTVLGIETSCDDTGVAIVSSDGRILGEALASQEALHEEWGGVVPGLARDAHAEALDRVVAEALDRAGMATVADVDAIAVTVGPGLEICLRVGCEGAKALALTHDKPFIGVHHLEAHVLMARLAVGAAEVPFPFLTLLTSGGHCQLLLTRGLGQHAVLGSTLDDALGEAFDKVARLLELPVGGGGGPALEALAREGDPTAVPLPIPMQKKRNFDFSFAGLKTAVRLALERTHPMTCMLIAPLLHAGATRCRARARGAAAHAPVPGGRGRRLPARRLHPPRAAPQIRHELLRALAIPSRHVRGRRRAVAAASGDGDAQYGAAARHARRVGRCGRQPRVATPAAGLVR